MSNNTPKYSDIRKEYLSLKEDHAKLVAKIQKLIHDKAELSVENQTLKDECCSLIEERDTYSSQLKKLKADIKERKSHLIEVSAKISKATKNLDKLLKQTEEHKDGLIADLAREALWKYIDDGVHDGTWMCEVMHKAVEYGRDLGYNLAKQEKDKAIADISLKISDIKNIIDEYEKPAKELEETRLALKEFLENRKK